MAVFQSIRNLFFLPYVAEPELIIPAPLTDYRIKPVTHSNLAEIVRLNVRCFKDGENYSKNTFNYLVNEPRSLSYKAIGDDGSITGFIFVLVNSDGAGHITTICVAPEHRRRGVAKLLLEHTEGALAARSISTVMLEVRVSNHSARELYIQSGYTVMQRVTKYYNNGEDGYLMMKSLV